MKNNENRKLYFCGNEVSEYGQMHGYMDYATLAKAFDAVLNNEIIGAIGKAGYDLEQVSGGCTDEKIEELYEERDKIESELDAAALADDEEKREHFEKLLSEKESEIDEAEQEPEIFQYFIVSDGGAEILKDAGEILFYCEQLDMYIWGVTHFGTSWAYVLTDIKWDPEASDGYGAWIYPGREQ